MFKVFDFFQDTIKSCNVFTSPVNLRYKLDPDYNTFAGGFVSILLILLLMSVFFNSWMALLNKTDISSTTEVIREFDPSYMNVNSNDFMFAIGVNGVNLADNIQKMYFNLTMKKIEKIKGDNLQFIVTPITLEPCTLGHWEHLGEEFVETYKRQGLSSFVCPPKNTSMQIIGKWTSPKFTWLQIAFQKCKGPNCIIKDENSGLISERRKFNFNFFYVNSLLNPDQTQPVSMFLEDKDFTMFSSDLGTATNIYLGEYTMETDQSIFPWIQKKVDQGFIVNRAEKEVLNYVPSSEDPYCQLILRKSNVKLQIDRKFRKIDDMLSYIGGLFGIIAVAIGFVMNYYGQCSFELEMCQRIFDYQNSKQGKQSIHLDSQTENNLIKNSYDNHNNGPTKSTEDPTQKIVEAKDFGFLDFFLHILVYAPLKKICNIEWRRMQIYEESLEEMRQKLDIGQLMEKLTFYDRSLNALFDENQLKLLYLQEKFNFEEVRNERNMLALRQDIVANLSQLNEINSGNQSEQSPIEEHKNTLNQIKNGSSKRMRSFLGQQNTINLFQILSKRKDSKKGLTQEDANLPAEIQMALKKLDSKIEKGDVISTRIYNGLQYELLKAYEKSKTKKSSFFNQRKKMLKVRSRSQDFKNIIHLKDIKQGNDFENYDSNPSLNSINQINEKKMFRNQISKQYA